MEPSSKTEYIVTCSCNGMDKFAQEAYSLLFPDNINPLLYSGSRKIMDLADEYPNSAFRTYLIGISKTKDKFAYLFEVSDKGDILSLTNLNTGARVQ